MASLRQFLLEKKYHRIKLAVTASKHLGLEARINGVKGNFILDTGASNSCVDIKDAAHFGLLIEDGDFEGGGAGASNMVVRASENNAMKIGTWEKSGITLGLLDLSHINQTLENNQVDSIHGLIGADILEKGKGVIDYSRKCLYLK